MDFDDLDELAPVAISNQKPKGAVLDPIARNSIKVPTDAMLDERIQARLPKPIERQPKLRVLVMMGAADYISQEWVFMAHEAPDNIEMLVHEPPGHGVRAHETPVTTLQAMGDDAFEGFREAMDTGAFALLGHSIGCLTAVYIAERAKRELGVEPEAVFMLERGAAHIPAFSDYGLNMLKTDPLKLMQIRDPSTAKACAQPGELGRKALEMWGNDLQIENDTREIGFHIFSCPLMCFRCGVYPFSKMSAEDKKPWEDNIAIHNLTKDYIGHFGPREFEEWKSWTEHPDGAPTTLVEDANHMTIKSHAATRETIWSTLRQVIASWDKRTFD